MINKILKVSFVCMACAGVLFSANAAPTVKKLGGVAAVPARTDTSSTTSRLGSARLNTNSAKIVKPVAKPTSVSTSTAASTTDSNASRISLGKYLHGANVVKQNANNAAYEDPNLASRDSLILRDQISALEGDVADVKQDMQDHIDNTNVHVSFEEKEVWNNKQDTLTAGDGISINDGVISSAMKIPVGSENAPRTAPMWIE